MSSDASVQICNVDTWIRETKRTGIKKRNGTAQEEIARKHAIV